MLSPWPGLTDAFRTSRQCVVHMVHIWMVLRVGTPQPSLSRSPSRETTLTVSLRLPQRAARVVCVSMYVNGDVCRDRNVSP